MLPLRKKKIQDSHLQEYQKSIGLVRCSKDILLPMRPGTRLLAFSYFGNGMNVKDLALLKYKNIRRCTPYFFYCIKTIGGQYRVYTGGFRAYRTENYLDSFEKEVKKEFAGRQVTLLKKICPIFTSAAIIEDIDYYLVIVIKILF
jgi:hypothetical protein